MCCSIEFITVRAHFLKAAAVDCSLTYNCFLSAMVWWFSIAIVLNIEKRLSTLSIIFFEGAKKWLDNGCRENCFTMYSNCKIIVQEFCVSMKSDAGFSNQVFEVNDSPLLFFGPNDKHCFSPGMICSCRRRSLQSIFIS